MLQPQCSTARSWQANSSVASPHVVSIGTPSASGKRSKARFASSGRVQSADNVKEELKDEKEDDDAALEDDRLPECYTNTRLLIANVFLHWLPKVEGVGLDIGRLKSMAPAKKKKVPLEVLQEMFQVLSGYQIPESIDPKYHLAGAWAALLRRLNSVRQRLLVEIVRLPPYWPDDGIYRIIVELEKAFLMSRFFAIDVKRQISKVALNGADSMKL